jgi:hypothetical protein
MTHRDFTNRWRSESIPYISQQTLILIPHPIGPKISLRGSIGECTDVCGYSQPRPGVVPLRRTFLIWGSTQGMLVDLGYSRLGDGWGGGLGGAWVVLGGTLSGGMRVKATKSYLGESIVG